MKRSLSYILAKFCSTLSYDRLPSEVVEKAKISLLDTLGMAAVGHRMEASQVAIRTIKSLGEDAGKATIWLDQHPGRAIDCVLANSIMPHSFLHDDWCPVSHGHIGAAVPPTVITFAQENRNIGRQVLLATVAGYEASARSGVLSVPTFTRGFRAASVYAYFGTAAATAKLMGLEPEPFKNALGFAGGITGGVLQGWIDGTMEWTYQIPVACRNGILGAMLAKNGFRGADNILEGEKGVFKSFAGTVEGQEEAVRALGEEYYMLETCYKRFPTGGANQGSAAVAWDLKRLYDIDHRKIKAVRVKIPHTGTHERMNYAGITYQGPFHTVDQCIISKPFAIAINLKHGAMTLDLMIEEQSNPEITELAHKVHLEETKGINRWEMEMEVEMADGTIHRGDGSNIDQSHLYLNWDRCVQKFMDMAANKLGTERAEKLVDLIHRIEELDSVQPIIDNMVFA